MLCDPTCLTCSGPEFYSCLTCTSDRVLINAICECQPFSRASCSSQYSIEIFVASDVIQTFFTMYVVGVSILYLMNVRLKYTYRIFSMLQMCSYALNMLVPLSGDMQYLLRILYRTNGGFLLNNRFTTLTLQNAVCVGISLIFILIVYFSQFWVVRAYMCKNITTYSGYLLKYIYKLLESAYFLSGKYMILFFTQTIAYTSVNSIPDASLGPAILFLFIVALHLIYTIYTYKKEIPLHPTHYPRHFSLYLAISPLSLVVLPFLKSLGYVVYLIPVSLLIIFLLVGRQEKFNRWALLLYCSEVVMCCLPLGIVLISWNYSSIYCLAVVCLALVVSIVECGIIYHQEPIPEVEPEQQSIKSKEPTLQFLNDSSMIQIN